MHNCMERGHPCRAERRALRQAFTVMVSILKKDGEESGIMMFKASVLFVIIGVLTMTCTRERRANDSLILSHFSICARQNPDAG